MSVYTIKVTPRRELHSKSDTSVASSSLSPLSLFNNTKSPKVMPSTPSTDLSPKKSTLEEIEENPSKNIINGGEEVEVDVDKKNTKENDVGEINEDVETTSDTDTNDDENNKQGERKESPKKPAVSVVESTMTSSYQESSLKFAERQPIREQSFDDFDSTKKSKISSQQSINYIGKIIQTNSYSITICVIILAVIIYKCWGTDTRNNLTASSIPTDKPTEIGQKGSINTLFTASLNDLKDTYNQSEVFWANIESSFRHSVIKGSVPSVVMLVSDRKTRDLADQLVYDILKKLHYSVLKRTLQWQKLIVDPVDDQTLSSYIISKETDKSKLYVDRKLESLFSSNEKLALVKNIEKMPAHAMMLFYSYGDYENARYDGVLIFMRLNLDLSLSDEQRDRFDSSLAALTEFVEDYMFKIWSKFIAADQLRPLFTRIANNLCFVRAKN